MVGELCVSENAYSDIFAWASLTKYLYEYCQMSGCYH